MSLKKLCWAASVVLFVALSGSCKKEEEVTTLPYLEGEVRFNFENYVLPNTVVEMTATGAVHPEGKGIGWTWRINPLMETSDTVKLQSDPEGKYTFKYNMGDSLGTYTVVATAFADGYYSISSSAYITLVDPSLNGSLKLTGIHRDDPKFTDARDGKEYFTVEAGSQTWMRQNLAYEGAGIPYMNSSAMSGVCGHYYSWEDAQKVCPEGWRLPTDQDWKELGALYGKTDDKPHSPIDDIAGKLMVDATFNGETLWEFWPEIDITNESKMCMLPFGYANLDSKMFTGITNYAVFWTADTVSDVDGEYGVYRYILNVEKGNPMMISGKADKYSFGASVRCIKK